MTNIEMLEQKKQNQIDGETGIAIRGLFNANSGLQYISGLREAGSLRIIEGVARGTACNFLTSLLVYDQIGNLIYDANIPALTSYSRELSYKKVLEGILGMLKQAAKHENKVFNEYQATLKIKELLDKSYYETSYKAALIWAESIGISIC